MAELNAWQRFRITTKMRKEMYGLLASMTAKDGGGIPIATGLRDMDIEFAASNHALSPLLREVNRRMRGESSVKGQSLSLRLGDCLIGLVPDNEAMMIKAGEDQGDIARGLRTAESFVGATEKLIETVRAGLFLVGIYVVMVIAMFIGFSLAILPQMEATVERKFWPGYAKAFGFVADHMIIFVVCVLAFLTLVVFIFNHMRKNMVGHVRQKLDEYLWPFTTVRLLNSSAMLAGLSGFLQAQVPFQTAINTMSRSADRYMQDKYRQMNIFIRNGSRDYEAVLGCKLIPREYGWIIGMSGKTSDFAQKLDHIATEFIKYAVKRTERTVVYMNFAGMALVAANIAWIALSMFGIVMSLKGATQTPF